jgi:hypothetical protein
MNGRITNKKLLEIVCEDEQVQNRVQWQYCGDVIMILQDLYKQSV